MLGNKQGKQRLESVSDYVVFDVETTGISCQYDDVVEISALISIISLLFTIALPVKARILKRSKKHD